MNSKHNYTDKALVNARQLRKQMTDCEQKLWYYLRNRQFAGLKFTRQVPIGNYIVDFLCKEKRFIIELDGSQHMSEEQESHDKIRDEYLKNLGYKIIRIYNNELSNIDNVLEYINQNIFPSPQRGEG